MQCRCDRSPRCRSGPPLARGIGALDAIAALRPLGLGAYAHLTRLIAAIEVVRVEPEQTPGEAVGSGIEDPWRRFDYTPDPAGCFVAFEDPEFASSARDAVYYVRAR